MSDREQQMIALALGDQITATQTAALSTPGTAPAPTNGFPSALHAITQAAAPLMHQGKLFPFALVPPPPISAKVAIGTTIEGSPHHDSDAKQISNTPIAETQSSAKAVTITSNDSSSQLNTSILRSDSVAPQAAVRDEQDTNATMSVTPHGASDALAPEGNKAVTASQEASNLVPLKEAGNKSSAQWITSSQISRTSSKKYVPGTAGDATGTTASHAATAQTTSFLDKPPTEALQARSSDSAPSHNPQKTPIARLRFTSGTDSKIPKGQERSTAGRAAPASSLNGSGDVSGSPINPATAASPPSSSFAANFADADSKAQLSPEFTGTAHVAGSESSSSAFPQSVPPLGVLLPHHTANSPAKAIDSPALLQQTSGTGASSEPSMTSLESHRTLQATPTSLEVGVPGATQGWLRIRAESGSDGIHALLSSSSHSGQNLLRDQLPAINTYLQGEQINASVKLLDKVANYPDTANARSGSGMDGHPAQQDRAQTDRQPSEQLRNTSSQMPGHAYSNSEQSGIGVLLSSGSMHSGSWLSVLA
jgi:hypothetical protein